VEDCAFAICDTARCSRRVRQATGERSPGRLHLGLNGSAKCSWSQPWSSTNGGSSFAYTRTISVLANSGEVDGPKAIVDPTNNTGYVWWRNVVGQGTHHLRKVLIGPSGQITLANSTKNLTSELPGPVAPWHVSMAIRPAASTSSKPRILLSYATTGQGGNSLACESTYTDTLDVSWYLAYTDDEGDTWTSYLAAPTGLKGAAFDYGPP